MNNRKQEEGITVWCNIYGFTRSDWSYDDDDPVMVENIEVLPIRRSHEGVGWCNNGGRAKVS